MQKFLISFVVIFTFINCRKQDNLISEKVVLEKEMGLGLLNITFNTPLKLYKNPKNSIAFDVLTFSIDSLAETKGKLLFNSTSKLKPYRMLSGDSDKEGNEHLNRGLVRFDPELIFRVIEKTNDYFKIILNEDTFVTAYIKINPNYALYTELSQVYENSCSFSV